MKRTYYLPIAMMLALITYSCSDEFQEAVSTSPTPLKLTGQISQENVTRANDYGFVTGDRMGIYVVDYEDNQPGDLAASNIRAQNVLYTFDGDSYSWSSSTSIYWRDKQTPVSIYGYYPGQNYISDPTAWTFSVQTDQSTPAENGSLSGYEQSDLLWGKQGHVEFTQEQIIIKYQHILAGVRVHLNMGTGISDTEWQKLEKIVLVNHTKTSSTVDLSSGSVIADGEIAPIRMADQTGDNYRAVVIPQTVAAGKQLLSITLDGQTYSHKLTTDMNYLGGKLHNFTMTVNKSEATGDYEISVSDDGITPWVNDESSHQFTAMAFVTVHCPEPGKLKESIQKAGYNHYSLQNLKITGFLGDEDHQIIFQMLDSSLKNLNLKEATFKNVFVKWNNEGTIYCRSDNALPRGLFQYSNLHTVILPSNLKIIGRGAFAGSKLRFSTLEIPEGVTYIGEYAFQSTEKNGMTLILPSTLDSIGEHAFEFCEYDCEYVIPDGIRYVGEEAFNGSENFRGTFHVPSKIGTASFRGLNNFSGEIEFPLGMTEVPEKFAPQLTNRISLSLPLGIRKIGDYAFDGLLLNSLSLPEGLAQIGDGAFEGTNMPFQLHLPSSLMRIGKYAFDYCKIKGELSLPSECIGLGEACFTENEITSLLLPSSLERIPQQAFASNPYLKDLVLPKHLTQIDDGAFAGCGALQTIVSLNPDPPMLIGDVFGGYSLTEQGIQFDKCVLEVPKESVDAYRHAAGWSQFMNITAHHELAVNITEVVTLDRGTQREGLVRAEGTWEVAECPSWCHLEPIKGSGKTMVTLTVDEKPAHIGKREGNVVLQLNGTNYTTEIPVRQLGYVYNEDETIILQKASAGAPLEIPLFFVGEGYNADDIVSGKYIEDMKEQMEHFFSLEPYKTYRHYFTVSTAVALSRNSGIPSFYGSPVYDSSRFGLAFEQGYLESTDPEGIWQYALAHGEGITQSRQAQTTIVVVCNIDVAAYNTKTFDWANPNLSITYLGKSKDASPNDQRTIVCKQVGGIGFGKLATEGVDHFTFINSCTCPNCNKKDEYIQGALKGWYQNVSLTGKVNDVPWKHLIFDERYATYVNLYEGGLRHARGVYRSEQQSIMSTGIPYFNTISREAIVKRIMEYCGLPYSFTEFKNRDIIEKSN